MEKVDALRRDRVLSATRWTNFMLEHLGRLSPELLAFIGAIAQHPTLAAEFTENFNYPERQWDVFSSPQRTGAWIESRIRAAAEAVQEPVRAVA